MRGRAQDWRVASMSGERSSLRWKFMVMGRRVWREE